MTNRGWPAIPLLALCAACSGGDGGKGVADTVDAVAESAAPFDVGAELGTDLVSVPDDGTVPEVVELVEEIADAVDLTDDVAPPPECNGAVGKFPPGLTELKRDDGGEWSSLVHQGDWAILDMPMVSTRLWEAARFDLEHPAVVHGFSVLYGHVPEGDNLPVTAGLYPDFGNNGFDFWQFEALQEGSRCSGEVTPGEWVTYVLDEPVEFAHPVPVYVAHLRQDADSPAWGFDLTLPESCEEPSNCCNSFSTCGSAWNFPDVKEYVVDGQGYFNWNGLSLSFSYDYMVRLYVEYTDDVTPEEHFFKKVDPGPAPGVHFAWGDYDNDGWDDLLGGVTLYRNVEGIFEDVSVEAGLEGVTGSGGAWGDYDNDGCLDILVYHESYTSSDKLFHSNCDGTFSDVTEASGITDLQSYNLCTGTAEVEAAPSNHAAWVDIDGDSYLDLYVTNYICWATWTSYPDSIWHNEGDGTFTEWMGKNGFWGESEKWSSGRGANPLDIDFDGDVDIMVNNYHLHRNLFYENNGDGTVTERAIKMNVHGHPDNFGMAIQYGHSCGVSWGDLDSDGDWDMVVANLAHPRFYNFSDKTQVLVNNGSGEFTDIQGDWSYPMGEAGIRYQEGHYVPVLGDIDQDGILDLAISSEYHGRPTDFLWGNGDGTFELDSYHAGITLPTGNCMAVSDFDHDGDLDMGTRAALWRNDLSAEDKGHWVQLRLQGNVGSNAHAFGATVRVHAGEQMFLRYVAGGTGQGCQDTRYLHVGLGDADEVDFIEADFPAGATVTYDGPFAADQRLWLYEDGASEAGWGPP